MAWDRKKDDFIRAGGDTVCDRCGKEYRKHPLDPEHVANEGGYEYRYLHRLCDGTLVKL